MHAYAHRQKKKSKFVKGNPTKFEWQEIISSYVYTKNTTIKRILSKQYIFSCKNKKHLESICITFLLNATCEKALCMNVIIYTHIDLTNKQMGSLNLIKMHN